MQPCDEEINEKMKLLAEGKMTEDEKQDFFDSLDKDTLVEMLEVIEYIMKKRRLN